MGPGSQGRRRGGLLAELFEGQQGGGGQWGGLDAESEGTGPLGLGKKGRTPEPRRGEMHQAGGIFH